MKNNIVKKVALKLSLVCEELGAYAAKDGNDKELNIYILLKIYKKLLHIFYLDDSGPAILNKKLTGTDLILGNYNLLESMASKFIYQNVSGYNIFIIKFDI